MMGAGLAPSTGDPAMLAYQDAVKSAQEQRKNGFMGRVVLPGEMTFEQFRPGYQYKIDNPNLQPSSAVGNDGNGPGGVTLRPTPGATPIDGLDMGVQMPPGFTPLPPGELGFTENIGPLQAYTGGSSIFDESAPYPFADGGSVSDALADALSNDIGDYAADDTMTDLSQTSYDDFDPGGNESYDAASMNQFSNQQRSDLSDVIGQQIQNVLNSNEQMGTPAPVPQSMIEQMQFENLQNVPQSPAPVFSAPNLGLGGMSTSFDLLGNPLTIGFEDGGSVPPRETDIRGQDHMLSYITPDEADILMALGGSGEPGPMGIPAFRREDGPGSDNFGSEASSHGSGGGGGGGGGRDDNEDPGDFSVNTNTPKGSDPDDPFAGEEGDDFSDPNQNYGNDDGSFDPTDFVDYGETALDKAIAKTKAINAANQQSFNNLNQRLAETQLDPMGTLTKPSISDVNVIDDGSIESLDALTNAIGGVNTGVSKGTSSTNGLLGDVNDLLGSLDKAINKVSNPTPSETITRSMENQRMQNNQLGPASSIQTETVVGSSDPETYDPDLDQATKDALANIGVEQSVIDNISRGSSESGLESEGVLGALGIGSGKAYTGGVNNRFGTATGPGRLSTVTAEEMEALRTGNAVQRQMYRQLAGIKSAGPVLSSFDPNNVKDPNFLDTIANNMSLPSSAVEVFRAPITEQKGFKSVNTGTFKDGIAGVTGEGNMPGVMGGLMQMFGIDPIVYTGDNRFDPNRQPDDFGGGGDNVLLPLPPEEVIPESTDPNKIGGIGTPGTPIAAGPVLVPSTRTSTPFSGQMPVGYGTPQTGQINPYSLSEMQRYQQMLARLNQPRSPIGLADGGSVLDAAAGKFLESLTAA